jgi:hypothetical protein
MGIAKKYRRIADQLRTYELVADDEGTSFSGEAVQSTRFVGFYSRPGLRKVLEAYGIADHLRELGFTDTKMVVDQRDPFTHRFQLLDGNGAGDDHRLIDLQIHLHRIRESMSEQENDTHHEPFDTLAVEWLCLQNPHAAFDSSRPRLPGQKHPGLGLAYVVHNVILLMARRIGRDGVLNVPEHFHLAPLYHKAGYQFVCPRHRLEVDAAARATSDLHLALASWAVERDCLRLVGTDGATSAWHYEPAEMIAPVSDRLATELKRRDRRRRRAAIDEKPLEMIVDLDALERSLREDPVDGISDDLVSSARRRLERGRSPTA